MEIGTGIFLASIVAGLCFIFVKTRDSWPWKKIVLWACGIPTVFLLCFFGWVYFSGVWQNRLKVVTAIEDISIGQSVSDILFKKGNLKVLDVDIGQLWLPSDMMFERSYPMKTISSIRSQYPEYSDLSDVKLADRLYEKFYSDMEKSEFYNKVGLVQQPVAEQQQTVAQKPTIEARLADGRVLRFPDGTSPEVVQGTVKKYLGLENDIRKAHAAGKIDDIKTLAKEYRRLQFETQTTPASGRFVLLEIPTWKSLSKTAKVLTPDGRTFTVEFPDGATPEQIISYVEQNYQSFNRLQASVTEQPDQDSIGGLSYLNIEKSFQSQIKSLEVEYFPESVSFYELYTTKEYAGTKSLKLNYRINATDNKTVGIWYFCDASSNYSYTTVNRVRCGDTGESIQEIFGNRLKILCENNTSSTQELSEQVRAYAVADYGVTYILKQNNVVAILALGKTKMQLNVNKSWGLCT